MEITDPGDFRQRIERSFARQGVVQAIDAQISRIEHRLVEIELPFHEKLTQQHGILHAGVIAAGLDTACTYAAYTIIEAEASLLTIEFKVNLLAPGKGERFLFRRSVTKPGRCIIVADGQAYAFAADGEARLIATMTGTMMTVTGREGIEG